MIMHDELKHIFFESLKHGNNNYNNNNLSKNMSRFGMRATIVWSGSGVLALGCLLRCVSLDSQVLMVTVIMIMMFDQGFEMDQLALWGDEWVVEYHDRGNNHTTQSEVQKFFISIFTMTSSS